MVIRLVPLFEFGFHRVPCLRPISADFGQSEVPLGKLSAAAVHLVEDVYNHIQCLVRPSHFLDVKVHICDAEQAAETSDIFANLRGQRGLHSQARHELTQPGSSFLHQLRDINPERIIPHLHRLIKLKGLRIEMEPEPGERLGVPVEKLWRLATHHAVQRRHALLAVQQEFHHAGGERPFTTVHGRFGFGGPHEQAAHRAAQVERSE